MRFRAVLERLLRVGSNLLADVARVVVHSGAGHALHMMRNKALCANAQTAVRVVRARVTAPVTARSPCPHDNSVPCHL